MPRVEKQPKISEHSLQVQCVQWFRFAFPNKLIFAVPNGGARNIVVATKLRAEGVLKGVPDLFIPEPNLNYHGLFIELKVGYNKPTEYQKELMQKLIFRKYACAVCYTFEEFEKIVKDYFI